jgi:type I restriction enzyme S subunit
MNSEVREPSAKYLVMQGAQRPDLGWRNLPLGHVLKFQRGFDLPHRVRREGAIPVVSSAGVTDFHDEAAVLPPGVVTGRYGTIGQLFYLEERFWPLNTTLYVRDFQGNDPKFVYYLLHSFDFGAFSGKSGVPGVNRNDLHAELVSIPRCVEEQRAIATALSDVDALIAGLERLIAKKRDIKQATMQQLLTGQTRLPGFSGEWKTKLLGELAEFYKGKGLPKSALSPYGAEPCIHYGELFTQYSERIEKTISYTDLRTGIFRSRSNDVLMPTSDVTPRGLAKASCVLLDDVVLGGDILVIRTNPAQTSGVFLSYVIRQQESQVLSLVTGSTVFHLYGSDMGRFVFAAPSSLEEQTAIATVLSDMDADLSALEARLAKTRAIKQGMMHE